jgi:OMF family outer membrane factor
VDLRQPLFRNFGPLVQGESVIQAQQRVKSARRDYERQKADLLIQVVDLFETLIRLERQIAAEEASLQRLDKLLRLTRARERQGRATRVEALRVELRHGEARSRLEESRERLSSQRRDFAELLGQPPDHIFVLASPPLLELTLPTQEEAARLALENRLDYAQALQDYEDTLRGERIARRGLQPDLSLLARYEWVDTHAGNAPVDDDTWFVGLSGNTDLNQTRERASLGQARLTRESARESVRIRELTITREVQQQTSAYRRAIQEMNIAARNHHLAMQRARLARRLYELGRGDNFSVTDAEEELTQSEDRRLRARADASLAGYRFLNTVGTLIEAPADLRANLSGVPP